jgi:hypothetical protein
MVIALSLLKSPRATAIRVSDDAKPEAATTLVVTNRPISIHTVREMRSLVCSVPHVFSHAPRDLSLSRKLALPRSLSRSCRKLSKNRKSATDGRGKSANVRSSNALRQQRVDDRRCARRTEWLPSGSDRRTDDRYPAVRDYTSVCSAISSASSTSIPRYRTVLSSLCPARHRRYSVWRTMPIALVDRSKSRWLANFYSA